MDVSREARAIYAQQISKKIDEELKDPANFTKNKVAEEAISHVTMTGGDDHVSGKSS